MGITGVKAQTHVRHCRRLALRIVADFIAFVAKDFDELAEKLDA